MATLIRTGEKCRQGGIYSCVKDNEQISLGLNNTCPPCPKCKKASSFRLIKSSN